MARPSVLDGFSGALGALRVLVEPRGPCEPAQGTPSLLVGWCTFS